MLQLFYDKNIMFVRDEKQYQINLGKTYMTILKGLKGQRKSEINSLL